MRTNIAIRYSVLFTVLLALLAWPNVMRGGVPYTGIEGQTFLHDSYVVNLFTRQVGVTGPFQASLRVYSVKSEQLVTTIRTDREGRFQVRLRPGVYRVAPDTMWQGHVLLPSAIVVGSYEAASAVTVQVTPHRVAALTITYERMMGN